MTDAIKRQIVDFAKTLPAIAHLRPEQQGEGVLFVADDAPIWEGEQLSLDQYGGEDARIRRSL